MKKLPLVMISVFLWCNDASAAIAIVQHISNDANAGGITYTDTFPSTTGSGNLLVCAIGNNKGRSVNSVADDKGNNFTQFPGAATVVASSLSTDIWYLPKSTSGSQVMTVTYSGAAASFNKVMVCWEVSGFTINVATDGANVVAFGTEVGSTATGASVTTNSTNGFVVGYIQSDNFVSANPLGGNEFTSGGDITANGNAGCSLISSTAASHQPAWTIPGVHFSTSTAAFKNASLAPTVTFIGGGAHIGGGKFQ